MKLKINKYRIFVLSKLGSWASIFLSFKKTPIQFITEKQKWSIHMDGVNICKEVNKNRKIIQISSYPYIFNNKVIHFGSQYYWTSWEKFLPTNNNYVSTFFHGKHQDGEEVSDHIDKFINSSPKLSKIVTGSTLIEKRLLKWGIDKEKLVKIPIGVDTKLFFPPTIKEKLIMRKKLGINKDKIVIGSFQKDGVGWKEGKIPKLIKGPDLLVESIIKIAKYLPVVVLLTGPARGYVKYELEKNNIEYIHVYHKNYEEIANCYKMLDLYLITSREEGGPKGIVESMASGVPLVTTNVGMASDFIIPGITGSISKMEPNSVAENALSLYNNKNLNKILKNARDKVLVADWENVAKLHWDKVYKPLIKK